MREKTYRIGEAADMLRLKSYVLRFWETEFPQLAPLRTDKGQRLYTDYHIALLHRIRHLLHEQGMTIEGARRVLASTARTDVPLEAPFAPPPAGGIPAPAPPAAPLPTAAMMAQPVSPVPMASPVMAGQPTHPTQQIGQQIGQQPLASAVQRGNGQSIDRTVVREMRDELLALRNMLTAED